MQPITSSSAPDPFARRREAGAASRAETRQRLLAAADALFRERGYPATAVAAISKRAGVSLQTLYLAWGSKRALLRAATDAAAVASQAPLSPEEWHATIRAELANAVGADPTAAAYLAATSRLFVHIAERTAPYWRMHRQAAATDPEIAADWVAITHARRRTLAEVARSVPPRGLRPGVAADDITETLWALASPEMYDLFTVDGGHDPDVFEAWLTRTLTAVICSD
jgi:AcrR family transcriptional regulator